MYFSQKKKSIALFVFITINSTLCFAVHPLFNQQKSLDDYYMKKAIHLARKNPNAPFAALIVDNKTGKILARGLNASKINPTFHGEMVAINNCIKKYPHIDWSNVTLYTTAEPCSMCQSAVVWAKIPRVVFATSFNYLINHGWDQINIRASEINKHTPFYKGTITGGIMAKESNRLFDKNKKINHDCFTN